MHNHLPEELVRLHREDLMAAAQRSRLRAIVRATRPPRRSWQCSTTHATVAPSASWSSPQRDLMTTSASFMVPPRQRTSGRVVDRGAR